jgi:hypothetical protein
MAPKTPRVTIFVACLFAAFSTAAIAATTPSFAFDNLSTGQRQLEVRTDNSSGFAVINQPVTQGGTYLLKTINLSLGPVNVCSNDTVRLAMMLQMGALVFAVAAHPSARPNACQERAG